MLQYAIDLIDKSKVLQLIEMAVKLDVDIIELGTPLIHYFGLQIIRDIRSKFPNICLNADLKFVDMGKLETEIVIKTGANYFTVSALASDKTIQNAVITAKNSKVKVVATLMGQNSIDRAIEVWDLGVDLVIIHKGIDEEGSAIELIKYGEVLNMLDIKFSIGGGITLENLSEIIPINPEIIIIGRGITEAKNPYNNLVKFIERIKGVDLS